jgi:hypothetical protein
MPLTQRPDDLRREVRFKIKKETKSSLRNQEVDEKGEVIEQAWAKIGIPLHA